MTKKPSAPFRFKQFTVQQERAAMKVGFDGILLGAWTEIGDSKRVLDVGTGTGLVALMLAQRTDDQVQIDAIEIDSQTCEEAKLNASQSPWSHRVAVECVSFQEFHPRKTGYDLVVCNPPYFQPSNENSGSTRAAARQNATLNLVELIDNAKRCLRNDGHLSLVYPTDRVDACIAAATKLGFHLQGQMLVRPLPNRPFHRVLLDFGLNSVAAVDEQELTIEEVHHKYTDEFKQLARDFYLAF